VILVTETSLSALPERIPFWKMSGCGNDFVVIDNRAGIVPADAAGALTKAVCRHRVSVGADGVVLIQTAAPNNCADFDWRYINADGNDGEFCGNGSVCGARFAYLNGIAPADCTFSTASGLVRAHVSETPNDPRVTIAIADPGAPSLHRVIDVLGRSVEMHAITVGVPHAVMVVEDADAFLPGVDFVAFGRAVRLHSFFAPAGVNFNAISVHPDGALRMRTYERGVEDETLACGSGSIASAVIATALGLSQPPTTVITSSGRPLFQEFSWDGTRARDVKLGGEARIVATGEIWPDALIEL
jgi:diaminopimelate epimerase